MRNKFLIYTCVAIVGYFCHWFYNVRPFLDFQNGRLSAYTSICCSDSGGRLVEIGPQEGEQVGKGDFLFALNREPLLTKQAPLKETLKQLEEQIVLQKEQMVLAMDRYLIAASQNLIDEVEKHLAHLEKTQAKSAEAEAQIGAVKKELEVIEKAINADACSAPFAAIVLKRHHNEGSVVSFGDAVYSLYDPTRMWIDAEIPEKELNKIRLGTQAQVKMRAYPRKKWDGTISCIGPASHGMIPIKILLNETDPNFKPGLTAEGSLRIQM